MALKRIGIALLVPFLTFTCAPKAMAHAQFRSSYPSANQVVKVAPTSAWILFNEDILTLNGKAKNYLQVVGASRERVDVGSAVVVKSKISVNLRKNLQPGKYQLQYRVVSADGHALKGSISFTFKP